jgi:hypothetical protein
MLTKSGRYVPTFWSKLQLPSSSAVDTEETGCSKMVSEDSGTNERFICWSHYVLYTLNPTLYVFFSVALPCYQAFWHVSLNCDMRDIR